jgi:molybdopterin-guanine dinucleotide biosynthesis protein A
MGRDKGLAPFLGRPLIQRVIERAAPLAQEVIVTTNKPEDYAFLGLPLAGDLLPGRGALGGLYTALSAASMPLVIVLACDMPFASPALLRAELALLNDSWNAGSGEGYQAVIPRHAGGTEPFHAVYHRASCLPLVGAALEQGSWRVDAWFSQANLHFMGPAEVKRYDPQGLSFFNINTPEELVYAENLAQQTPAD